MFRRMTVSMLVLLVVLMLAPALPCLGADGGLRYSIMVSKFQNRANWAGQWDLGDAWGAVLTDSLMQTGKFIVLGEKDMRQEALEEQDLASSGRAAGGGKTVATGQITPAQLLIKGDITHFADSTEGGGGGVGIGGFRIGASGSNAEINAVLYVVDSTTGQVVASKKCYGKVSETGLSLGLSKGGFSGDVGGFKKTNAGKAVEQAVDEAVAFIISKMPEIPWAGDIIMVKGDRVYINRGTREGVSAGQTFQVGKVEVLRDPKTGEVLDQTIEKAGMVEILSVKEKVSIGKVTQGSGISKGMTVMRPE
jgi:curli biogenesis system outer membrane secretion channel CsgG